MLTDICCQTDAFTHCIFTVVSFRLYTQKKDLSAALTQDLPSWVRWVGKSSPEGGRWARLGFDPSFYKGKIFVFPFILSHICCKTTMFFFISFHIVKYLLQNSNVVYHVCGMLKAVETKNNMFRFPNAIINFFSQQIPFRHILIYIFFGGLQFVGHYFASGAYL